MTEIQDFLKSVGLKIEENGKVRAAEISKELSMLEDYILLFQKGKTYYIYEVHRSDRILEKQEQEKSRAVIWAVILYKRMNDNIADRTTAREIRRLMGEDEERAVQKMFCKFDDKNFSIGKEQENCLCLMKNEGGTDVLYNGITIIAGASLARAYVTLYNYCQILQEIKSFYNVHRELMEKNEITEQEVAEVYMGVKRD